MQTQLKTGGMQIREWGKILSPWLKLIKSKQQMFQPTAPRLVLLIIRHCIHNLYTYIYWSYSKSDKADKYCHNYLILKWGKAHVEEFMIKCAHSYLLSFVSLTTL